MAQQTAVEWLGARLYDLLKLYPTELEAVNFLTEQAKKMEKEQIKDAYYYDPNTDDIKDDGDEYYNEIYGIK